MTWAQFLAAVVGRLDQLTGCGAEFLDNYGPELRAWFAAGRTVEETVTALLAFY